MAGLTLAVNATAYPLGNGRDEADHLRLIAFYETQPGFPILPDDRDTATIQAHQPPLYYAFNALAIRIALPSLQELPAFEENPFLIRENYNPAIAPYNRVLYVHNWQNRQADYIQTFKILRGLSLLMHLLGVGFGLAGLRLLLPDDKRDAQVVLAGGMWLLVPSYWRSAFTVSNDQMLVLWVGISFWLVGRMVRYDYRRRDVWSLGIALGFGMLTKVYMAPLLVSVPIFLAFNRRWRNLISILGITSLTCGWWYVRNLILYGDPSAATMVEGLMGTRRSEAFTLRDIAKFFVTWHGERWVENPLILNTEAQMMAASLIGTLIFVIGFVRFAKSAKGRPLRVFFMLKVAIVLIFAGYAEARNIHADFSAPLLLSAAPALAAIYAFGLYHASWRWVMTVVLALFSVHMLFFATAVQPLYPQLELYEQAPQNDMTFAGIDYAKPIQLVSYHIETPHATLGGRVGVKLCWQARDTIDENYAFSAQLILPDGTKAAQLDGYHLSGRYPTNVWRMGEIFCERLPLQIANDALTPRSYQLYVKLYPLGGRPIPRADVTDDGVRLGFVGVTSPDASASTSPTPRYRVENWAGMTPDLRLEDENAILALNWHIQRPTPTPYSYFLHVLDAEGNILAQHDILPLNGAYRSDYWIADTRFQDELEITLPDDAARLTFGMYDPQTGIRALWYDEQEYPRDGIEWGLDELLEE